MGRRPTTIIAGALALLTVPAFAAETVDVFSTSGCGCCIGWMKHLEEAGFEVSNENLAMADLYAKKTGAGLKPGQTSCHTGFVGGYVVEGHVPAAEVKRLLAEKPDAIGLAVPDMPAGSPGMGTSDEPYEVLLVARDGTSTVFARYPK
ncbi:MULTISPECIES: DUF411 domain-containing protein [Aureimonas]|uniref:Uncharacterized conserved protein n=2 Tax=Aureimonas TaxID=414371 RepID=A0A1H0HDE2_9HYPH|nr:MULTISPECIES: DUF411 domain-containing protein [Aureimonas]MBB3934651.1 hypothetical protein [Aureimonas phyllosphaerae]MBB3950538.1 hypothetical protein [Aureimonas jatrophae]MBB3958133.1 hypothetical protein [Aureimonas phyllosphaerae]SDO17226.1 Uncharacterized conserved protein [Aureimonas jatrophae]SFE92353.1 Uncharacterized conserved protein [Aureimonas phyllosphaerae]